MASHTYENDSITVTFDGARCIHARRCVLALPAAFREGVRRGWIQPGAAHPDEIAMTVMHCPSGALRYRRGDGGLEESKPAVNTVQITEDGPLHLRAELTLNGQPIGYRATLCRCGHTRNAPFCDLSHAKAGFRATGQRPAGEAEPLPARDGSVDIRPVLNGPLSLVGNMELITASGAAFTTRTTAKLCRCGRSENKPFCDGSHKAAGFTAPGS